MRGRASGIPEVWLRIWWSVISLKKGALNSGKYLLSESFSESLPCSASCKIATAANCLDTDAMQKLVLGVTGVRVSESAQPKHCSYTFLPSFTSTTAAPGSSEWNTAEKCASNSFFSSLFIFFAWIAPVPKIVRSIIIRACFIFALVWIPIFMPEHNYIIRPKLQKFIETVFIINVKLMIFPFFFCNWKKLRIFVK